MQRIPLVDLPGSRLLHDWLRAAPSITSFFDVLAPDDAFAERRARGGAARSRIAALAVQGMRGLELTPAQQRNLEAIADPRSVMVATGQQIGLLGGPLYTVLKIATAAATAQRWQAEWGRPVVPVFWLEDNDHDAKEAATAHLVLADGSIETVMAWDETSPRQPVATRRFSAAEVDIITKALATLSGPHADSVRESLSTIYVEGASWADAFVNVLQPIIGGMGVIIIRASDVVASGMHVPLIERDLAHPGGMAACVASTTAQLTAAGYHEQAQASEHAFFLLDDEGRQRLRQIDDATVQAGTSTMSYAALRDLARLSPERFSPGVLARPIMQDAILPTVACVLGPAELAYHAQLADAYAWFGVQRAAPVLRHSATLLDAKAERLLTSLGTKPWWYARPWESVLADITASLDDAGLPAAETTAKAVRDILAPWLQAASQIDSTLTGSVEAAGAAMQKALDQLEGKMRAALRRKHSVVIDRHKALHMAIVPMGITQERISAITHWCSRIGVVDFTLVTREVVQGDQKEHFYIGLSSVGQSL
ncbi:MAG: bacillithiol biosynthesis cysteine-adding enzyme BshC [Candidatus Kapabacteria bacterium]|nr:bacillithiol biosynthesis cysteine-adding enzyme BshC [Candidatus Kapabacteria bacterium]